MVSFPAQDGSSMLTASTNVMNSEGSWTLNHNEYAEPGPAGSVVAPLANYRSFHRSFDGAETLLRLHPLPFIWRARWSRRERTLPHAHATSFFSGAEQVCRFLNTPPHISHVLELIMRGFLGSVIWWRLAQWSERLSWRAKAALQIGHWWSRDLLCIAVIWLSRCWRRPKDLGQEGHTMLHVSQWNVSVYSDVLNGLGVFSFPLLASSWPPPGAPRALTPGNSFCPPLASWLILILDVRTAAPKMKYKTQLFSAV